VDGLLPGRDWKKKVKGELWFLGNTYHLAIGQGDLALTPLEIDSALGAIASGGKLCQPRLVGLGDCRDLKIKRENLDLVKEGMKGVCRPGGTGYTFFDFSGPVACKTGTAETNEDGKTHAWFSVFTPADFPEIILTVLVEGGGEGSKIAGPLARSILDYWQVLNNP
jgi:penicillin-binding protein 2